MKKVKFNPPGVTLAAPQKASDALDQKLAAAALRKSREGKIPHRQELAALNRIEKSREEAQRWQYYHTVPIRHYCQMAERQLAALRSQSELYGIPCKGVEVDLAPVIKWLHDTVSDKKFRRVRDPDFDDTKAALDRNRLAQAEMREMELKRKKNEMLTAEDAALIVGRVCSTGVQCLQNLENSIAGELAIWISDDALRALPADQRADKVRKFVAEQCRTMRQDAAKTLRQWVDEIKDV